MMEELAGFVVLALIFTLLALTLVVWLRQDMYRMEDRMNERLERLEGRLAAVERVRAAAK